MRTRSPLPVRVVTHNIRYATDSPSRGEQPWDTRRHKISAELLFNTKYNPEAFVCLQEVLHNQLSDTLVDLNHSLQDCIAPGEQASQTPFQDWAYIGVGREDGIQAGEYSPIIYRPSVWELKRQKTVWLSETPDLPSKSWDAASIRILTIGVFRHRQSRKIVVGMNTHLDDQGANSRLQAALIIQCEIERFCSQGPGHAYLPVFLAGDFNSETSDSAYQLLNSFQSPVRDVESLVPLDKHYGHKNTYTGFSSEDGPAKVIDYIFIGPRSSKLWQADGYAVLENCFDDGTYSSDHRAVVGDLSLD